MPSSRSLGSLTLDMIINMSGFEKGADAAARKADDLTRQVQRQAQSMQASIEGAFTKAAVVAGAAIAGIGLAVGTSIKDMYELVTLSKQVAVPTDQFSAYVAVANDAEVSTEDFTTALKKLSTNIVSAQQGGTAAIDTFKAIGISVKDLKDKNPAQVWLMLSDALSKYRDDAAKVGVEQALLGRSGSKLNDLMNMGSKSIEQQAQHMRDLGVAFDQDGANKLSNFDGVMDEFHGTVKGLSNTLALELVPMLTEGVKKVTEFIQSMRGSEVIKDFVRVLGTLLDNLGAIAAFFVTRLVAVRVIAFFGAITTAAGSAAAVVASVRVALAALGGPVGVAATAVGLLAAAVVEQKTQMSGAQQAAKDLRKAIDELNGADSAAVKPAADHTEAVKKLAVAQLAAAQASLVRLVAEQQGMTEAQKRLEGASHITGGRADSRMGASYASTATSVLQGTIDRRKRDIAELQKTIADAQKAIDKVTAPAAAASPAAKPGIKLFDPAAAAEAKKKAEELARAVAALDGEVQKINAADDPAAKITEDYAGRIRHVAELGVAAIKAGDNVQRVQAQVASASQALGKQMAQALDAPNRAMLEYTSNLQAQLLAHQNEIDLQVQSVGLGDKQAQQLQELTKIRQDGAAAIAKFALQHQLNPDALTDEQYAKQMDALKKYWDDYYAVTQDGQKRVDAAQENWMNGVTKAWQNFVEQQRNTAQIMGQLAADFLDQGSDAFASFVEGTKSAKDALLDFITSFEQEITRAISRQLLRRLFSVGGDDASGGLLGSLLGGLGGMLGPGTIGAGLASGGYAAAGSLHPVNEQGPELLTVGGRDFLMMGGQSGRVTPSAQAARAGTNQTNNFYLAAPTSAATQNQIANKAAYEMRRAARLS